MLSIFLVIVSLLFLSHSSRQIFPRRIINEFAFLHDSSPAKSGMRREQHSLNAAGGWERLSREWHFLVNGWLSFHSSFGNVDLLKPSLPPQEEQTEKRNHKLFRYHCPTAVYVLHHQLFHTFRDPFTTSSANGLHYTDGDSFSNLLLYPS